MIDHVLVRVADVERSKAFYENVFTPLGYSISFGEAGEFWSFEIGDGLFEIQQIENADNTITPVHVAFRVSSRDLVDAFYRVSLDAGARDNGAPGPRPQYTEHYYSCFILDPDGHNIEVMVDPGR